MREQSETLHIENDLINKDQGSFSCYASESWRTFLEAIFATMRVRGLLMTDAGSRMQAICWGRLSLLHRLRIPIALLVFLDLLFAQSKCAPCWDGICLGHEPYSCSLAFYNPNPLSEN